MKNLSKIMMLGACVLAAECQVGCGADFEPGSRVSSPRILALQADKPFARPGEDVALTLLAANPDEEPLEWAWATCTLPASSTVDDCIEALDNDLEPFDPEAGELHVAIPDDVLDGIPEGLKPSALIGVIVVACPGQLEDGETLGVPVRCVDEQGRARSIDDLEVGIKRIMLREHDRNDNPAILEITWDGEPWDEDEVQEAELCEEDTIAIDDCSDSLQHHLHVTTTEREASRDEFGGDFTEQVIVQLYSTHGLFRDQVRIAEDADTYWVAQPNETESNIATLWFITRDDRGGVSWTTRTVSLR